MRIGYSILFFGSMLSLCTAREIGREEMIRGFENPPSAARPQTWWHWMNGNISSNGITADLEAMQKNGIGGAQIFNISEGIPHGPVMFNSDAWIALVKFAALEARRLGLELGIHNCAGWSATGGPWISCPSAMKDLTASAKRIQGPVSFKGKLPLPPTTFDFYRDVAVIAFPTPTSERSLPKDAPHPAFLSHVDGLYQDMNPSKPNDPVLVRVREQMRKNNESIALNKIRVLTGVMNSDGTLTWEVPDGDWTVMRFGFTVRAHWNFPPPREACGLECDKLSKIGIQANWNGHLKKLVAAMGPLSGQGPSGFNNMVIDSYEPGRQNWTDGLEKEFQKRMQYDVIPYLLAFTGRTVESKECTARFVWDFRRLLAEKFVENYAGEMANLLHQHGLVFNVEAYGWRGFADTMDYGAVADVPMGEFFLQNNTDNIKPKDMRYLHDAASTSHLYGRKMVGAEAFSSSPKVDDWKRHPYAIKVQNDQAFCLGVNRLSYHSFAHNPWTNPNRYPGMSMGQWGLHFDRGNTWWKQSKDWILYQARCQFLLQEGRYIADLCYYCGENAPESGRGVAPQGYACDNCGITALEQMRVEDGFVVTPSGMRYRVLALACGREISPRAMRKIADLARAGATIAGPKPLTAPGLSCFLASHEEVLAIADEIWPKYVKDSSAEEALKRLSLKQDFSYLSDKTSLSFLHRTIAGTDVYFVASDAKQVCDVPCVFRTAGRVPELWDAETGNRVLAPVYSVESGMTKITLRFAPAGSIFVVFADADMGDHVTSIEAEPLAWKGTVETPDPVEILYAEWGETADAMEKCVDVTRVVKNLTLRGECTVKASNTLAGTDPAPLIPKKLFIECLENNKRIFLSCGELETCTIPKDALILCARFGVIDPVREAAKPVGKNIAKRLLASMKDGTLTTPVNTALIGEKVEKNAKKELRVVYRHRNLLFSTTARAGSILSLPEEKHGLPSTVEVKTDSSGALRLLAWSPVCVTARTAKGKVLRADSREIRKPVALTGPWTLSFPPNWGAPKQVTLNTLISWTDHPDEGVKHFSGTATYTLSFNWKDALREGERYLLNLGEVQVIAEITLNGKKLPVLWKPPFRIDVTDALRKGNNVLTVEVTNLWPNRMIGDEQLPPDREWKPVGEFDWYKDCNLKEWPKWFQEGKQSPTGRFTFYPWNHVWNKSDPLLPSGLLGPVVIHSAVSSAFQ